MKIHLLLFKRIFSKKIAFLLALMLTAIMEMVAQQPGNALIFDGVNDYVSLPNNLTTVISSATNNGITIEYWYKGNNVPLSAVRFNNTTGFITSGVGGQHVISTDGGYNNGLPIGSAVSDGRWHHVAMTWQRGATNGFKSYLDGQLVAQRNAANVNLPSMTSGGYIGCYNGTNDFLSGSLDEVRIYNVALTQANIQSDMVTTAASVPLSLQAYYNFNSGVSGGTNTTILSLRDTSGKANHGVLTNFALSGTASNWIESYAMVVPTANPATAITSTGFTANWSAATVGTVNNYVLDVSTSKDFAGTIGGSPFTVSSTTFSQSVTGLLPGTYYYRVRATKTGLADQGCVSKTIAVTVPYAAPGNALALDGSNDYVNLPAGICNSLTGNMTIESWFYINSFASWQRLFDFGNGTGNYIFFSPSPNATTKPRFELNTGSVIVGINSTKDIVLGKWYHLAVTINATTNVATMYLNGQVVGTQNNFTYRASSVQNSANNYLGKSQFPNDPTMNGRIDEFRIWNLCRSQADIQTYMDTVVSPTTPGLLNYYNFDQGVGGAINNGETNLNDLVNATAPGTLNNFGYTGSTSNWVESYGEVIPMATAASAFTTTGFTANWTAASVGVANNYLVDVSLFPDFSTVISGSPFSVTGSTLSKSITGLLNNTNYYYRVRADKSTLAGQGAFSNTIVARTSNALNPPGNCMALDGADDYMVIPAGSGINDQFANNRITAETWVYLKSLPTGGAIPALITEGYNGAGGQNIKFAVFLAQNTLNAGFILNGNWTQAIYNQVLPLNRWMHIAATYDQNQIKLYVNGVVVATQNSTSPLPPGSEDWYISKRWDYNETINGSLDEVRVYNEALTAAQIQSDMRDTTVALPGNLVAYYNFDQGSAGNSNTGLTIITDRGPSANYNATLTNSALTGSNSNYISSYAMVVPVATAATSVTSSGFTVNWTAPKQGSYTSYLLDVSTTSDFNGPAVTGSPFTLTTATFSQAVTGLIAGTYYYRVRAINASFPNQSAVSNTGSVLINYSVPGNALAFKGSGDIAVASISTSYIDNFTMEGWVNPAMLTGDWQTIFAYGYDNGQNGSGIALYIHPSNGDLMLQFPGLQTIDLNTKIDLNRWSHVALSSVYLNGVRTTTVYLNGQPLSINSNRNPNGITPELRIGGHNGIRFLNGKEDEFRFWAPARTAAQIAANFKTILPANSPGLVVYYNFDQGVAGANNVSTNVLLDQTGNRIHASLSNISLTGSTSNWVESYAAVEPVATAATSITPTSFIANWTAPTQGTINNYYVEVSSTPDFTGVIAGSPFIVGGTTLSRTFTGLIGGTYYYRVSASKTNMANQGAYSNTIAAVVPYTPPGNALAFDGVNDWMKCQTNNLGNFGASNFTIEWWMKTSQSSLGWLISKRNTCGHGSFFNIGINGGGIGLELDQDAGGGNYNGLGTTSTLVNDNRWHHVAVVREGVNVKIYIDGVVSSSQNSNGVTWIGNDNPIDFGQRYCSGQFYNGSLDEMRFWGEARTQSQIQNYMDSVVSPSSTNLLAYYNFDNGIGGLQNYGRWVLKDVTPYGNDVNLAGFSLEALNTNWVESYGAVIPKQTDPTNITPSGFTLNWNTPKIGVVTNYFVDVSLSSNFTAPISGSPFTVSGNSLTLSGLASSAFYCRVRANNSSSVVASEGGSSNVKVVDLKYVQPGNALKFDGSNDYGIINRNISGTFTIEYWVKTTATFGGIVDNEVGGTAGDWQNGINSNGKIYFIVGSGGDVAITSNTTVNNDKWYHVAMTRNQTTGLMRLYINGNLEANATGGTGLLNLSNNITLGAVNGYGGNTGASQSFNGAIDELRIWNVERSVSQISQFYKDTVDRNSTGLVDYYRFDQGIGGANNTGVTTLKDIAGTDNAGTISNFALSGTSSNWVNSYNLSVQAPNTLTASSTSCGTIDLNWQIPGAPSTNCETSTNCDLSSFKQFIYLDDSILAIVPATATSYSFNVNQTYGSTKLIRGVNYRFTVRTAWVPPFFNFVRTSLPTNIATGKFKDNPVTPSGFTASLQKCDGSIDLSWTWTDVNPQNGFIVNRSLDSIMKNSSVINLAGTQRSYTDAGLQRGTPYFYRIYARNDCFSSSAPDSMFAGVSDTAVITSGISPQVPNRPSNVRLFADSISNTITIRWNDNSNNEDKFAVERAAIGGLTTSFDTNPNDTVFVDAQAAGCVTYNYTVKAYSGCATSGMPSIGVNQTRITPNLSNTFEANTIYQLKCSKGYYPDRVELNWNNRNTAQLSSIRIYRKVANSTNDSILIASVLSGSGLYIDNTTVAGILYKYFLVGETQCAGVTRYSNMTQDIGFRSPSGIVNGTITYAGGYSVKGVRVLAQNTSFNKGGAIAFDGINDYLEVPHQDKLNTQTNALTIETWFKPYVRESVIFAAKKDSAGGFVLDFDSISNQLRFKIASAFDSQTVTVNNPFISFASYNQITAAYGYDSIRIYINGLEAKTVPTTVSTIGQPVSSLYMGGSPTLNIYGQGNMDEVRIWKISKTKAQIVSDFNRTLEMNNGNLLLYYNFDDRFPGLKQTYDQSNLNLVFNANDGNLLGGVDFTDSIPSSSQLALASYTNESGNYTIPNVRYVGTGQNYLVVPALDIHNFSPSNRVIFVGDGAQTINSIDFTDNSSFQMTGLVRFAGTTCPAAGANVMIDGQYAILNSTPITVNDSGKFVIQVPIGNHVVTLSQAKRTFSQGRFPTKGFYDFEGPVSANFVDSTFLTVVGRVAGGNRELNKLPGLGRSKNNIGKAQFNFTSVGQSGITGCFTKAVVTNDSSGEYIAQLLPLRYTINGLRLVNNPDPTLLTDAVFNNPNILDLTTIPEITSVVDTLVTAYYTRIDSIKYHKQLDFKYYVTPKIYLTDTLTPFDSLVNNFIGETQLSVNDSQTISLANNPLGYPVFQQGNQYIGVVKVLERYTNIDKPITDNTRYDNVPVAGTLRFFNDLGSSSDTISEVSISNGVLAYNFTGGVPNQLRSTIYPQYNYTRTLQIQFVPSIGYTVNYLPNTGDPNSQFYRGFVFGSRPGGNNFTTKGPALVDFVLRDPPGSLSSTTWSKGQSRSKSESYSLSSSFTNSFNVTASFGAKVTTFAGVGLGVVVGTIIEEETKADISFGSTVTTSNSREGEVVTTITNNSTISTGSDPSSVGPGADIYYGKAINIIFGNADVVELIDTATCSILSANAGVPVCSGTIVNGYQIGKRNGFYIVPGGIATTFAYTQDEITNLVIPDLIALRNQMFTNNELNNRGQKKYTAIFNNTNDPDYARKFGSNNDDPIWKGQRSSPTPFVREARDSVGQSYLFRGNTKSDVDSIRFYNDQIRLWKVAIARNEAAKYRALNNSAAQPVSGGKNISIGKAMLTEDFTTQTDQTYTESFEVSTGIDIGGVLGFDLLGIGTEWSNTMTFEKTSGASRSGTTSKSSTYSYTLQDGDDGDLISVDVVDPKEGGSHMFKLRAGRTSCPYEGQVNAMFYDPSNDTITATTQLDNGFEIQAATAQNDVPLITVDQRTNFNVPASDEAIFILNLGNLSEGHQDRTYSLRVNQATNPFGAILKVDGLDPNRDFTVPYGTTIQKTLTVKRGPVNYDYNNIQLILKSACDDNIFDTVSISARFLPTCTGVELKSPDDRWVLNNSYRDTLPVIIGGYNYNWGGFQSLHFQYKPGGTNTWYDQITYFKDTADPKVKIPLGDPTIYYPFSFKNLPDGNYELKGVTECIAPGYPNTRINSTVMQGLVDRVNPTPFGTPSPANGILSPSDDISIQFNEPIEQSTLSLSNFEVKGVLNQSDIRSNTSIYLDGNSSYLEVAEPLNLQLKPFTLEFWHKKAGLGKQVLFSQGADTSASFEAGFTTDNKFYFKLGSETVFANTSTLDTTLYNFYTISYNSVTQTADLFVNQQVVNIGNNRIFNPYNGSGKFYMGKASTGTPWFAKGNIYEVRLWGIARTLTDANLTKSKLLTGTEAGLIGNWRMDEATGKYAKDYARSRNALLVNAQWYLSPMGKSYAFDGSGDFITVPTGHFGITKEMDFTIEFWFKGASGNRVGLLSNGTGLASATNPELKWSIETDSIGRIVVKHNGISFQATNSNYFDGNWHHFALVLKRNSSLSCYVDANLQNSIPSGSIGQWGGLKLWMGAKGWNNNGNLQFDSTSNYFNGKMDDLRFWTSARLIEQITRDKNNRLNGTESGLVLYVPFESYQEVLGFPVLNATNLDITSNGTRSFTAFGDAKTSDESPTLKLPRAAQSINFTYNVNGDKIIITPTTANQFIENVTLDITVKDVYDLHGNKMQSPKTWIAYVNKNQVKWQDDSRVFNKVSGGALSFDAVIINSGGALKTFTIGNLPSWLKASVTSGTINPSSSLTVTFTVDPTMNIGKYEQDITLLTDFGFPDKLLVKVNVYAIPPTWSVNPANFSKSMSIIGQVRINNVISANTDDLLGAFVNNECRAVGKVQYYAQLDKYLVFMDVYGTVDNENLEFRIWNSATGKTHIQVDPALPFVANSVVGSVNVPQIFNALDKVSQSVPLQKGWNWLSFNLLMTDSANLNNLFQNLKSTSGNQIKNNTQVATYDSINGWSGTLANISTGVKPERSYLFYSASNDTLQLRGVEANPTLRNITYTQGWNYVGFVSQRLMSPNDALAGMNASQGDLIKGQTNFAVYDTILGWVGSLTAMKPSAGYLLKAASAGSFYYPRSAMFGKKALDENIVTSNHWLGNPYAYQANMNIIGKVNACSNIPNASEFMLGAFVNDELRGLSQPQKVNGSEPTYFMNIAGKEGDVVKFSLLDDATGNAYALTQAVPFKQNDVAGSLNSPFILSNTGPCVETRRIENATAKVYPIPFSESITVEFSLIQDERVSIKVIDISGKVADVIVDGESFSKGNHQIDWKSTNLPTGVYIIELQSNSSTTRFKVVKI